jgi:uncharacterized protein YbjT (DUF2867 family)/catechol 2,3-dioxygenase-like lactoylglutathione lyase family enzyme
VTVLVAGATGTLGRAVAARLGGPRLLSRRPGPGGVAADLVTGAGVDAALSGVDAVINCATARGRDAQAAATLLDAAERAGVRHLVHVSIVGIDRVPLGYYREKLAVEALVEASPVPTTTVRATQFHELVAVLLTKAARARVLPVPAGTSLQPVAAGDLAAHLVALADGEPAGRVPDFGGPQVLPAAELARAWRAARRLRVPVVPVRFPGRVAAAVRAGGLLCPDRAVGTTTFGEHVTRRPDASDLRIEIFPADLDASAEFYTRVLGFRITRDERAAEVAYLGLDRGRIRIGAVARDEPADRAARRPPTGVEIVLEVADVEAELDRVRRAGWPIEEGLASQPWGQRDFRLLDPSGYYVRLTGA